MKSLMLYIIPILATAINNGLMFMFLIRQYEPRYGKKSVYLTLYLLFTTANVFVNRLYSPLANLLFIFLEINILSVALYKTSFRLMFLRNQIFVIILYLCDVITIVIVSGIRQIPESQTILGSENAIIANLIDILLVYFGYKAFTIIVNKSNLTSVKIKEVIILTVLTVFEMFSIHEFILKTRTVTDTLMIIVLLAGFIFTNVIVIMEIRGISNLYKLKYENDMIKQQNEIQLKHLHELDEKYTESRKVIHDARKHMMAIAGLGADVSRSGAYANLILERFDSFLDVFSCSSKVLTVIVNQKMDTARMNNIKVTLNIEDVDFGFITDIDMTAVFANLWDNAIEACLQVDEASRYINVNIGEDGDFILVNFENSFNGILTRKMGKIMSSKRVNREGYGLSIISKTVAAYDGFVSINEKDHEFCISIVLPVQKSQILENPEEAVSTESAKQDISNFP